VVDFVRRLCAKTELPMTRVVSWLGIARGKFFDWRNRYGKVNEHNAQVPPDHWIEMWERRAIIEYFDRQPLACCRRRDASTTGIASLRRRHGLPAAAVAT
jgi:putative transposase